MYLKGNLGRVTRVATYAADVRTTACVDVHVNLQGVELSKCLLAVPAFWLRIGSVMKDIPIIL